MFLGDGMTPDLSVPTLWIWDYCDDKELPGFGVLIYFPNGLSWTLHFNDEWKNINDFIQDTYPPEIKYPIGNYTFVCNLD